jgi:hypothetical protein
MCLFHPFNSSLLTDILCCFESSGKEMMMTDSISRNSQFGHFSLNDMFFHDRMTHANVPLNFFDRTGGGKVGW